MADLKEVKAPDVGGDEVEVIEILVSKGDSLEAEDSLITVESDKASMDIPAPFAGVVAEMKVKVGDKIKEGDLLAMFEAAADSGSDTNAEPVSDTAEAGADAQPTGSADEEDSPAEAESSNKDKPAGGEKKVIEVTVPDIGEDGEVDVIEVLVSEGDEINAEDGLITVETDKATMDVPSPEAGVVKSVEVKVGDKVKQGSLVIKLEITTGSVSDAASAGADTQSTGSADADKSPAKTDSSNDGKDEEKSAERKPPVPDHPLDKKSKAEGLAFTHHLRYVV